MSICLQKIIVDVAVHGSRKGFKIGDQLKVTVGDIMLGGWVGGLCVCVCVCVDSQVCVCVGLRGHFR